MSYLATKRQRMVVCAMIAALVAPLLSSHEAHAEVPGPAAPDAAAVAAVAQSGGCGPGGVGACGTVKVFGVWCEICDGMYVVEGSDGKRRLVREAWTDCGVS